MIFGNPSILYFLGLLAIPIIIHFFHFRKHKRVYFSDISLLKTVQEEQKSRRNVKHWILLLLRLLAIAAIVFAFAKPYIPLTDGIDESNDAIHAIYIDNSFSMNAEGTQGQLIESSKKEVYEFTQTLPPTAEVFLITNDFIPEHMRVQDIRSLQSSTSGVTSSPSSPSFSKVVTTTEDILFQREQRNLAQLYVFSDFQKSQFDFENLPKNDQLSYNFIVKQAEQKNNIYIDSIWVESPVIKIGQPIPISFKIVNESDNPIQDIPVYLEINDRSKGVTNISVAANSTITDQIVFVPKESGYAAINLFIEDAAITYDDNFYGVLPIKEKIDVLLIHGQNATSALENLYGLDSYYNVENVNINQLNVDVNAYDLVIFNDIQSFPTGLLSTLKQFIENGGHVLVSPDSENVDLSSFNSLLSSVGGPAIQPQIKNTLPLSQIDYDQSFFDNIFESEEDITMPKVGSYYPTSSSATGFINTLLSLKNGVPFLLQIQKGQGQFYWQAAANNASDNNWSKHALFTAIYLRIAERSVEKFPLYYTIGKEQEMQITKDALKGQQSIIHVTADGNELMTTEVTKVNGKYLARIGTDDYASFDNAGIYDITSEQENLQKIAFNFDRSESNMEFFSIAEIQEAAEQNDLPLNQIFSTKNKAIETINTETKKEYWRILLILGIVFLIAEILINRLWKTT